MNQRLRQLATTAASLLGNASRYALLFVMSLVLATTSFAAPDAGVRLGNQAVATYLDASGLTQTVLSNLVEVVVTQVPGVEITTDTSVQAVPGGLVTFPHTIINRGNGTDSFTVAVTQDAGDNFDFLNLTLYADADQNGIPDNLASPFTGTPPLAPGESFPVVLFGQVPAGQAAADIGRATLIAASVLNPGVTDGPRTDQATVTLGAVMTISKALNRTTGLSPSGQNPDPGYQFTLNYTNSGLQDASVVVIQDVLPAGLTYKPGTASWSISGVGTPLTEVNDGVEQSTGANTIDFQQTGQTVTARITNVSASSIGFVRFRVQIDAGLPAGTLVNTGTIEYDDGTGGGIPNAGPIVSNPVAITILPTPGVDITAANSPIVGAPQGSVVVFRNVVTNNGTATDVFDITLAPDGVNPYPAGTIFTLYKSDNVSLLLDTDSDSVPDTGPLAPGATYDVFMRAQLPPLGSGGGPYREIKTATSSIDPAVIDTTVDELTTITPPTNVPDIQIVNHAISDPTPSPGDTVQFSLTWENQGSGVANAVPMTVDGLPANFVLHRVGITNTAFVSALPPATGTVLYHVSGTPANTYVTVPPANPADVDYLGLGQLFMPIGGMATLQFNVTIDPIASQITCSSVSEAIDPLSGNPGVIPYPPITIFLGNLPPIIEYHFDPAFNLIVDHTPMNRPLYVQGKAPSLNVDPFTAEIATITIVSQKTGDSETFPGAIETGPNTGIFQILNGGLFVPTENGLINPVNSADGTLQAEPNDILTATISAPVGGIPITVDTIILIDPAGIVFNSVTGQPVAGATVSLIDVTGGGNGGNPGGPAVVFLEGGAPAPDTVVTGADGAYQFPLVAASIYQLQVVTPAGFVFASAFTPAQLPPGFRIDASGSYGGNFPVNLATGAVFIDIPVDPLAGGGLLIAKTASRDVVELGESVDYQVVIRNNSLVPMNSVTIVDILPRGFRYQRGSARLKSGTPIADPVVGIGTSVTFNIGTVVANSEFTLLYRVQVGAGANAGDNYNTAQASALQAGVPILSNVSRAKVRMNLGVFSDRSVLFGRVYVDKNLNDIADMGEPGVPGVRVFLEDGTFAITDIEGKYSLHGISSGTHVTRVDPTTMPPGSFIRRLTNRHGDRHSSRFVDMRGGELYKSNFAIDPTCPNILENVAARRTQAEVFRAELEYGLERSFLDRGPVGLGGDVKSRPSQGFLAGSPKELPDFKLPKTVGAPGEATDPQSGPVEGPAAAPRVDPRTTGPAARALAKAKEKAGPKEQPRKADGTFDYAAIAKGLSSKLGFVTLTDGAVVGTLQPRIQVKGHTAGKLALEVNGEIAPASQLGARVSYVPNQVQLLEYVGLRLKSGTNTLTVKQLDGFGNARGTVTIRVRAAGEPAKLVVEAPNRNLAADATTLVPIVVKLLDADGLQVPVRTQVTLESDKGRWKVEDIAPGSPGVQSLLPGGEGEFSLYPPSEAGTGKVRVTVGDFSEEVTLSFVPPLRPLIIVGVVEGKVYRRKLDLPVGSQEPLRQGDPFETEFVDFFKEGAGTATKADVRGAFYLKGKIRGERLLTVSYDSTKDVNTRLFRDIQPEEFYPIYGDSSIKGYDAQSTGKFYVRLDKGANYSLYGDYDTRLHTAEARELGSYSRSMNGVLHHSESRNGQITAFASRGSQRQVIEEFRANGTSGPYQLGNTLIKVNSEKVEVLVRDREQPAIIISTLEQSRFRDYALEPFTGRIVFKAPLPSVDRDLNPRSIRVTYELESGGKKFLRAGVAGDLKVGDRVTVGMSYVDEDDPIDDYDLRSAHIGVDIAAGTNLVLETARSDRRSTGKGDAKRLALTHQRGNLTATVRYGKADATFDNPTSTLAAGRDEFRAQANYQLNPKTAISVEAIRTGDTITGARRSGKSVAVRKELRDGWALELGLRDVRETLTAAQPSSVGATPADFTSGRLRLDAPIGRGQRAAGVYAEYEQDLSDSDKRLFALGGEVTIHEKTKIYARHELISTLGGRFSLTSDQSQNSTVVGIESDYMKDGRVFSEYRGRDAFAGRETEAAIGLRNQFHLGEGLRLNTTFEKITVFQGAGQQNLAFSVGADYTKREDFKVTSRFEFRNGPQQDSFLTSLGVAYKLDRNWSTLGRYILNRTDPSDPSIGDRVLSRLQLGVAFRPVHDDRLNWLLRFENRVQDDPGAAGGGSFRDSDILSTHVNYNPTQHWVVTGRYAARWTDERYAGIQSDSKAQLIGGRVTHEVGRRWDLSAIGSRLFTEGAGAQDSWGLELGRQVGMDFWLSFGFNFAGFTDPDLQGDDYTERGVYFRVRAKFDEETFRRHPKPVANPADCAEPLVPAPPKPVFVDRLPEMLTETRAEEGTGTPRLAPSYAVGRSSLVRILAPASTARVSAVFPWGPTKPLEKTRGTNYWQTRFLLPDSIPHGVYDVALVITDDDGTRSRIDYVFHADRKPPEGRATATKTGGGVLVEVGTSRDVRRVEAALPNGEYVELKQAADTKWSGRISLPPGTPEDAVIPVLLYDTAHNLLILEVEVAS